MSVKTGRWYEYPPSYPSGGVLLPADAEFEAVYEMGREEPVDYIIDNHRSDNTMYGYLENLRMRAQAAAHQEPTRRRECQHCDHRKVDHSEILFDQRCLDCDCLGFQAYRPDWATIPKGESEAVDVRSVLSSVEHARRVLSSVEHARHSSVEHARHMMIMIMLVTVIMIMVVLVG